MMSDDQPKCRADLQYLAAKLRRRLDTLYDLSPGNDPYMADAPARSRDAGWATEIFKDFEIRAEVHGRRVHYRMISQDQPILQPDGREYVNTVNCFNFLGDAIRDARYLDLISTDVIIDRRNPDPIINLVDDYDADAEVVIGDGSISRSTYGPGYAPPTILLPDAWLSEEPARAQPYHLEIWIEKSTMDDVLSPLCRQYGINLVSFIGEASTTACKALVRRAIASGKPVRIGYISDFDPAGRSMPIAAAVKIDFFAQKWGADLDIRLEPIALTEAQCIQYQLPRTPIKETETRAASFEARFGAGATELDALEALHPGALREIVVEFIDRYYDHDLDDEVERAIEQYRGELRAAEAAIRRQFSERISDLYDQRARITATFDAINDPAKAVYDDAVAEARRIYEETLEAGRAEVEETEHSLIAQAEALLAEMKSELEEAVPDPELFDWPEPAEGEEDDDALYISMRPYVEQVDVYRAHQGKDEDVGLAADKVIVKSCEVCGKNFNAKMARSRYCNARCASNAYEKTRRKRQSGDTPQSIRPISGAGDGERAS